MLRWLGIGVAFASGLLQGLLVVVVVLMLVNRVLEERRFIESVSVVSPSEQMVTPAFDLRAGTVLREDLLMVVEVLETEIPEDAYRDEAELVGQLTLVPLFPGDPIRAPRVTASEATEEALPDDGTTIVVTVPITNPEALAFRGDEHLVHLVATDRVIPNVFLVDGDAAAGTVRLAFPMDDETVGLLPELGPLALARDVEQGRAP